MKIENILWATDFKKSSLYALEWAKLFAKRFNARIYALHVIKEKKPVFYLPEEEIKNIFKVYEQEEKRAFEFLKKEKERTEKEKIDFDIILDRGEPFLSILENIEKYRVDLLVMGTLGDKEQIKLGTTAYRILAKTSIPVLFVPYEKEVVISRILVPIDFSKFSLKALDYALFLAEKFGCEIYLIHVIELLESIGTRETEEKIVEYAKKELEKERERFGGRNIQIFINTFKRDSAEIGIIEFAQERGIDLICMATRGRKGLAHFIFGSTTEKVLKLSNIPVLSFNP